MEHSAQQFDVLLLADMTRGGDIGLRIRREVQALARRGYRCGLRHVAEQAGRPILPDIQRCVREGLATVVHPGTVVTAKLAIGYSPGTLKGAIDLDGVSADRVLLIVDTAPSPAQMGHWFGYGIGPMTWVPTNRWVRGRLMELGLPVPIAAEDWRAIAVPCRAPFDQAPAKTAPIIGRVNAGGGAPWPKTPEELDTLYEGSEAFDIWVIGAPPKDVAEKSKTVRRWTKFASEDTSVERFVEAIDAFVYAPSAIAPELPEAAIVAALASGKPVILPPRFRPHFADAAVCAEDADLWDTAMGLLSDEVALAAQAEKAADHCRWAHSEGAYLDRIEALIGAPNTDAPAAPATITDPQRPRALFVPSSGVGLGHTTRLLSIARRVEDSLEPVFASLGQAGDVFDTFGYHAEYIPSAADAGAELSAWDPWFRYELGEIIDRHSPQVIVFDGNNPTHGLVQAAMAHGACRLAWVRRAMGPEKPSPYLGNSKHFDCIIEPGEYARIEDRGPTSRLRHQVVEVPPVRLLDDHELLSRDEARSALGLAPDAPAVLIQPGAGANRDIVELTDRLITELRRFDGLQIIVAEWSNGTISLPHWPGTRRLRGFPMSRWFAAFDFSVAAAGYNTFHEVIAHGLPTIFIPNRHPSMDDQGARATFAQDNSAGFDLQEQDMHLFPTLCRAMLAPETNAVLRAGCARFDRTNGALQAAEIIKNLARTVG